MNTFEKLISNYTFVSIALAWFSAQFAKGIQ